MEPTPEIYRYVYLLLADVARVADGLAECYPGYWKFAAAAKAHSWPQIDAS